MFNFKGKRVLVAGGTGLIGIPLVELLFEEGAEVRIASLDDPLRAHPKAEFRQVDLTNFENCLSVCNGMDYVFNLLCVKGSPAMAKAKPASFLVPQLRFNTNLMEAARRSKAEGFLFASSLAVYAPAEIFHEDDVWKTFPSENDRFAGWGKRIGELQAQAYRIEHGWDKISIVRPANIYGPFDNFDLQSATVIPSIIKRVVDGENPLRLLGDGSEIRDFIYAEDAARGILCVAKNNVQEPVNLGSGVGITIRDLVQIIINNLDQKPKVFWDSSRASGDKKRVLDIKRIQALGFKPLISLQGGIKETIDWYRNNKDKKNTRYDIFA